jgi:hypothetical protein
MGYPSHPLTDLVIPAGSSGTTAVTRLGLHGAPTASLGLSAGAGVGTKFSNEIALDKFRTALALSIGGPSALGGAVVVQGKGVDDTWRAVQVDETDLNITAGDETLVELPGRLKAVRLLSSSVEIPARTFPVQVIYEVV